LAPSLVSLGIDRLSIEDRIALARAIWESIRLELSPSLITPAQREELQRRLQDHAIHPEDVVPWEQVKAETLAKFEG
jgi:putative addiction module component (TIGR02574 family)